jgi:hypothetical protein
MEQSQKYPTIDWTMNEYYQVQRALEILMQVVDRESKRHEMNQHLTHSMLSMLEDEIIPMLSNEMEYDGGPSDDEICGEPPMTADEMHTAAWRQHQELHS